MADREYTEAEIKALADKAISQPLVTHIYVADPAAHVFDGKVYVYTSHDWEAGAAFDDDGGHFQMEECRILRQDSPEGPATDCGAALHVKDVAWADRQMWDTDVAFRDGRYYLYFPAKRADGIFRLGVAVSDSPEGPFKAEPEPMEHGYSIDPAVFQDEDGAHYMYFGGIWGGQLQKYRDNRYDAAHEEPAPDQPALGPRVARLAPDMKHFAEEPREVQVLDPEGKPLLAGDTSRRFFEAAWVYKRQGRYYLTYSTGDTHLLCWATGDNPYGPFTYGGVILEPVVGWTTHHSIIEFDGRWWLYYHDCILSNGVTHLRSAKVTELHHDADGRIRTLQPYGR